MNKWLLTVLLCSSFLWELSASSSYKKQSLPIQESFQPIDLNDRGQIIGIYDQELALWDDNEGLKVIRPYYYPVEARHNSKLIPQKINSLGAIFGVYGDCLWQWNYSSNFEYYCVGQRLGLLLCSAKVIDVNENGTILGYAQGFDCKTRCWKQVYFLLKNGCLDEISLSNALAAQGYIITDVALIGINNEGHILGYFTYACSNLCRIPMGQKAFLYKRFTVQVLPYDICYPRETMDFNNFDQVIFNRAVEGKPSCYLWSPQRGLKFLGNFYGKQINDNQLVLGSLLLNNKGYSPCVWDKGSLNIFTNSDFISGPGVHCHNIDIKYSIFGLKNPLIVLSNENKILGWEKQACGTASYVIMINPCNRE